MLGIVGVGYSKSSAFEGFCWEECDVHIDGFFFLTPGSTWGHVDISWHAFTPLLYPQTPSQLEKSLLQLNQVKRSCRQVTEYS